MKYSEAGHDTAPPPHPRHMEIEHATDGLFIHVDDPELTGPVCQQLYRQHCLASAMLTAGLADTATLAFIAPAHNQFAHAAATTYSRKLSAPNTGPIPLIPLTLEHAFAGLATAGLPAHAAALHRRYTDWWLLDGELELTGPEQIEASRSALVKLVPDIETALDLLSEWSKAISKAYRERGQQPNDRTDV